MRKNIAAGKAMFEAECRARGIATAHSTYRKGGLAWKQDNGVYAILHPPIRGNVSLATALHELGHVALGHCDPDHPDPVMKQELDAWGFCKLRMAELGVEWTIAVGAHAVACMTTETERVGSHANGSGVAGQVVKALRLLRKVGLI